MNIDIKDLEQQDMKALVHSLELVSARIFESVVKINQTASSNTPEMNALFQQWVECLGDAIASAVSETGSIDPEELSAKIGVTPETIISLALTLHRQGKIKITNITAQSVDCGNLDICGCLKA
ncbi:MAG: hypothetical protein Q4F74_04590 [Synergistaceae bacterium]|nr:hypothetical protein [Synergistaceae bacterium]